VTIACSAAPAGPAAISPSARIFVDRELTGTIRALQGLAQSDRLVTGELPPFRDQAVRLLHEQSMWSDVILARPDGQQEMSSAAPAEEALPAVSDPDVFARVIATAQPMIGDQSHGPPG
jgi:predicted metal-dependent hydrolase